MSEQTASENHIDVGGIFEPAQGKCGQLLDPSKNGKARKTDPFIPRELVRRFRLKRGHYVNGNALHDDRYPNPKVRFIDKIDGFVVDALIQ